jgi:hypothetical protein
MKRFTALLLCTLTLLQTRVLADIEDVWVVPKDQSESIFNDEETSGGLFTKGVFPGLKLRIS